ncbi:hypothetical protein PWG15_26995 (plasmid) [Ensifer adhaerens]|uniref:hypothetical protein n=1 Tax=Ensifer adhaerens TaxID=106592 RepID=UPI0023A982FE|nr:hypothetical protein [Ensifer adhaerens]WDZ79132.1 hypothetical protein PWG15_26995 [Ensifer adhaerens]
MRDPINSLFRNYGLSELDEDLGLCDPDDLIHVEFPEPRSVKRRMKSPAARSIHASGASSAGGRPRSHP